MGDRHEYIVLKVSDKVNRKDVWVRFMPYLGSLFLFAVSLA